MIRSSEELLAEAEAIEKQARAVEVDSDSPLRVVVADRLWAALRSLATKDSADGQ